MSKDEDDQHVMGPCPSILSKPTTVKRPRINAPRPAEVVTIASDGPEEIEAPVVPTKTKARSKGKAKAESKPVENVDIEDSGDERAAAAQRSRAQKSKAISPSESASDSRVGPLEREIERLKKQLEQVRACGRETRYI